jgi:hypothetical protein
MGDTLYRIKRPSVVSETIDGEVLVLRLVPGYYYSLDGSAALIWEGVEQGRPLEAIQSRLAAAYEGDPVEMAQAVAAFLASLVEEELIEASPEPPDVGADPAPASPDGGGARPRFAAPVLNRYTDMQDLLVLDPIHDVSEMGWPTPRDA